MLFEHTCMFYVQIFIILLDCISGQEEDNQLNVDPVREQTLALFFLYLIWGIFAIIESVVVHHGFKNRWTFNCLFHNVRVRLVNYVLIATFWHVNFRSCSCMKISSIYNSWNFVIKTQLISLTLTLWDKWLNVHLWSIFVVLQFFVWLQICQTSCYTHACTCL